MFLMRMRIFYNLRESKTTVGCSEQRDRDRDRDRGKEGRKVEERNSSEWFVMY